MAGRRALAGDRQPAERLRIALDELYAWYEITEAMWTNVLRDETLVAALGPALEPLRAYLDDAARVLAAGWGARGRRRAMLLAAARHAVDFHTWRSLARDGSSAARASSSSPPRWSAARPAARPA